MIVFVHDPWLDPGDNFYAQTIFENKYCNLHVKIIKKRNLAVTQVIVCCLSHQR